VGKRVALCAIGFLLVSTHLLAQEGLRDRDRTLSASQRISADLRSARFRSGSFYLLSSIQLSDIGYESQFFVPVADQGSGISFGLSAPNRLYYVPSKKTIFSVQAIPTYTFFSSTQGVKAHNQFGYLTRGDAEFLLNHIYLDFYVSRSDSLIPFTGEVDRIATRKRDSTGIAGELKYSSRTSLVFQAGYAGSKFPSTQFQPTDVAINLLDRTEQNYRAMLVHKTFPLTALHAVAERSNYSFPFSPVKDSHRFFYGGGFDFNNGRTGLRAEAGPGKLEFRDPSQKSFSGVLGNAGVTHRTALWSFSAGASRDLDFSLVTPNNYYVLDRATALAEYTVTRRLKLRFSDTEGIDRYDIATVLSGGVFGRRRDTLNFAAVGWLYSFRRLTGGFDIGYFKRTSNADIQTEDGIRGILHLSFTP
jgi:hypothetical protein